MERLEFEGFGGIRLVGDAFGSPDDPSVLLIPSGGQTREFWHGSARALAAAGRHAICMDLRGHGESAPHLVSGLALVDVNIWLEEALLKRLHSALIDRTMGVDMPEQIAEAVASFNCRTYAVHEGGDHLMFVGEVEHAWFEPHRDPLLYFRGKYRRLHFT